jgi:hypothetical protein
MDREQDTFFGKSRNPTEDLKRGNRIQYSGPQAYEAWG